MSEQECDHEMVYDQPHLNAAFRSTKKQLLTVAE